MVDTNGRFLNDTRQYSMNPGTNYSQALLACMSAVKTSIKSVQFQLNGTASIRNLVIKSVHPVEYDSDTEWPVWAMEKRQRNISEFDPFWGITFNSSRDLSGLETVKRPDCYIPAGKSSYLSNFGMAFSSSDSTAGIDAPIKALAQVYSGGDGTGKPTAGADYNGAEDWFLYQKWMNLSKTLETTGRIIDYIWTDVMTNAVMGSTSLSNFSESNATLMTVTQ